MAEQPANQNSSDEIDLGQLFQMIGRGFNKLGIAFLRLFLYLKKNAFILGGLIVLGAGIGYGLNQIVEQKLKIEIIVKPNQDSENYMYAIIEEINSKIKSKDSVFFASIGAPTQNLTQYRISVEPIVQKKNSKDNLKYLGLLEKFKNNENFSDIIRKELLMNSSLDYSITINFKDYDNGKLFARKVMEYINDTGYYRELVLTSNENAKSRIERNLVLIDQVDLLISNYTEKLKNQKSQPLDSRVVVETEEPMDLTGLLSFKSLLIEDVERKKIELKEQTDVISVVNFGRTQIEKKSFFGKNLVRLPTILIALFLIWDLFKVLNKKSKKIIKTP